MLLGRFLSCPSDAHHYLCKPLNWWTGLRFFLSKALWNIDAYVMMDIEQMQKYRFFKRIGAFSEQE
jgi:hypothetical protein